jgi:carboxylesterase type B
MAGLESRPVLWITGTWTSARLPPILAIRLADAHASAASGTYMYEFAWPSPVFGGRLGAFHGLEIPFVFGNLRAGSVR